MDNWVLEQDKELVKGFLKTRKDLGDVDVGKDWRLLFTKDDIAKIVDKIAAEINTRFAGEDIVLACILKGAAYFFVDLTRKLTIPYNTYFIQASSYAGDKTQGECEVLSILNPEKFKGKKIILVDELFDNGKTLHTVKSRLLATPGIETIAENVYTCVCFQKDKEIKYPDPDLVGFSNLPDVWVVGYGLDDRQEKRGWEHLFACPRSAGKAVPADEMFTSAKFYQDLRKQLLSKIAK
eukprot:TRINITY_DN380_c0_g1_i1.p1 TRINITY_DN380_c0_g1~~TRINITY_DN380_c0_g1_i1.p1  ORF type:complete len:261 (-),score=45.75 TRINITY_DN380_c0_g1_i1:23-733(-)